MSGLIRSTLNQEGIRTAPLAEARGALLREYEAAIRRAGKVFNVVSAQSLRPRVLRAYAIAPLSPRR